MVQRKKLPPLGWCNIVVSRLSGFETVKALKLLPESKEVLQAVRLGEALPKRLRRGPRGLWYRLVPEIQDRHPIDTVARLASILWLHRDLHSPFASVKERKAEVPVHGVVILTSEVEVLSFVWAIQRVERLLDGISLRTKRAQDMIHELRQITATTPKFWTTILPKTFCVFYVNEDGEVKDISNLSAESEDDDEATWGQLNTITNRCGRAVRNCVNMEEEE